MSNINNRIYSLDVLRGLALAAMLLVNNPGSWSRVFAPLLHADWHGLTPTDLVFPFFLFVVGAAMAYSLRTQITQAGMPWVSVLKRGFLLIGIGVLLQAIPFDQSLENWRILGVLQRIGICFIAVAIIIYAVPENALVYVCGAVLLFYWFIMINFSDDPYSLTENVIRHVDIAVLGANHMWQGKGIPFDPEGLLSTLPSCITVLSGYIIALKLKHLSSTNQRLKFLMLAGTVLLALGLLWSFWHPINKSLWTGSFVLVTSAIACYCLAVISLLWDKLNIKIGLEALRVYGSNSIFIYVSAWFLAALLGRITFTIGNSESSIKQFLYGQLQMMMPDKWASFIYAFLFAASFYVIALMLYKKRVFIKL